VVKEARERTQFGLVVLIEHTLPSGKKIVSLSGHLRPSDVRVTVGQNVAAGDVIGVLGDSSENGGWSPHIHFGIHKEPYSGVWMYYGHVSDPDTANDWYDPEEFIPEHLERDTWLPEVGWDDLEPRQLVGDDVTVGVYATDVGSGVQTVRVRGSDDGKQTWVTLSEYTGDPDYPYQVYTPLTHLADGHIHLRVVAEDAFGNKTKKTIQLRKKIDAPYTRHVAALSGAGMQTWVDTAYQTGEIADQFIPFTASWENGGDIAVGYVKGTEEEVHVVNVKNSGTSPVVKVFTKGGTELDRFTAFSQEMTTGARVATGDFTGDGVDVVVVGSGAGVDARVRVFTRHGTLLTELQPFARETDNGVDVATGDIDGDGLDEIIVGMAAGGKSKVAILEYDGTRTEVFRAFGKKYRGGVNVAAGDVDGDGLAEILVGSGGDHPGTVRVFGQKGRRKDIEFVPFGDTFTGGVDVSSTDWELDGTDEVMMSQASDGEAWVKTYRFNEEKTVLFEERMFEEGFAGGAYIAGWK
jgi:hypothetical protein